MVAGAAQVALLQDEHALVAAYRDSKLQADREADIAAMREREDMRPVAVADAAAAVPLPRPAKPVRLAASARTEAAPDAPSPAASAAPLPLPSAGPPPRPAPVATGARSVLATVERAPRWAWAAVQNAADWAIIRPVQTIARLPERRFL